MKKVILILVILSVLTACIVDDAQSLVRGPLFGEGSTVLGEGVKLEVINYPSALKKGQPFSIEVELTNNLLSEVQGQLCLFDSPASQGVIPGHGECIDVQLGAAEKTEDRVLPFQERINFPNAGGNYAYTEVDQDFKLRSTFTVTYRYVVDTKHGATICLSKVRPDLADINCPNQESIALQQPSTPLQIVNVKKDLIQGQEGQGTLNMQFTIRQDQEGHLFEENLMHETGISPRELVHIQEISFGGNRFKCSPIEDDGMVELRENERVINCYTKVNIDQDVIQELFVVHLRYGFAQQTHLPPVEVEALGKAAYV